MKSLESPSIRLVDEKLSILNQQFLPDKEEWIDIQSPVHMVKVIKTLQVRGAPLIGVSAALCLGLWSRKCKSVKEFKKSCEEVRESRPTAVNLMNAINRLVRVAETSELDTSAIMLEAVKIFEEDVELCQTMADVGSNLIEKGDGILTHCNTGGLATAGIGTALGVIVTAHKQKKDIHVFVDETRPLLQGGRLTTWELEKNRVPYTLICDNMAGSVMKSGKVQKVFVGADRIAMNGDFANKIGTYSLAVLCSYHKIPFYVVAPRTTIDPEAESGRDIPIELRKEEEVRGVSGHFGSVRWAPEMSEAFNPAFDVTPSHLVTGMIIDHHVLSANDLADMKLSKILIGG